MIDCQVLLTSPVIFDLNRTVIVHPKYIKLFTKYLLACNSVKIKKMSVVVLENYILDIELFSSE